MVVKVSRAANHLKATKGATIQNHSKEQFQNVTTRLEKCLSRQQKAHSDLTHMTSSFRLF